MAPLSGFLPKGSCCRCLQATTVHNNSFFRHFGFSDVDAPVAGTAFQVYSMARLQPADDKQLPAAGRAAAGAADAEAAGSSRGAASSAAAGEAEERGEGKTPTAALAAHPAAAAAEVMSGGGGVLQDVEHSAHTHPRSIDESAPESQKPFAPTY